MGWTRSVAPVALIFWAAVFIFEPALAQSAVRSRVPRKVEAQRWSAGIATWNEHLQVTRASDRRNYDVMSAQRVVQLGRLHSWSQGSRGWLAEGLFFAGKGVSESRDSSLVYLNNNETLYGVSLSGGLHQSFDRRRVWIAALLEARARQVQYTLPSGFEMNDSGQRVLGYLRFEFAFPLSPRSELYQHIGIALNEKDALWGLGFRF